MKGIGEARNWRHALEIILEDTPIKEKETLDVTSAVGRVLASPIVSPDDYPQCNHSKVDGYAIISSDTQAPPVTLRNIGTVTAGAPPSMELQPGQCVRVMTGAVLPLGADAVVPFEHLTAHGPEIRLETTVAPGDFCALRGAEFKKGQEVIPQGTPIAATEIGLMAQLGMQQVQLHKTPTVALIVTGDELVEPWVKPEIGYIRNSNAYTILTLLRQMNLTPHYLGICRDDLPALNDKILAAMQDDMLIMVGGSAKGDRDFSRQALVNYGLDIIFDSIALKPGRTTLFARKGSKIVLVLPGPPGAMRTMCHLIVLPVIRKMMGHPKPEPPTYTGEFHGSFSNSDTVEYFLSAKAEFRDGQLVLEPADQTGTSLWCSWKTANALIRIPPDVNEIHHGDQVEFLHTRICL
jgi:molybdopterin molybdotransferase